jgi:ribulose-phosphate 3-epimerase
VATVDILRGVRVEPSILSADFGALRAQVGEVLDVGARAIHVDVMDGHFVPAIAAGPQVVSALREQLEQVGGVLDVHLMIERPERHVGEFLAAGAHSITFHAEATPHAAYAASLVRDAGACVGIAINPATPVGALAELAHTIDLALCMTINPGWAGQPLIEHTLEKVTRLRHILGDEVALQVDGGIDSRTAPACRAAGANLFVAGSAIFDEPDPAAAYRAIVEAAGAV